ncbi:MAG: hypothetical protein MUP80_16545, partial [Acidobacteriia bacterium]|nr:hypothetical protein [Terriglobia bacterium]
MAELRVNPVTRLWIVTGKRPVMPDVQEADVLCPFCPGNERLTPKAICETRDASGAWTTRVFHDRAPIFRIETRLDPRAEGGRLARLSLGSAIAGGIVASGRRLYFGSDDGIVRCVETAVSAP